MSDLLVKPHQPDEEGCILSVTPESAGWQHVGFEVFALRPGERISRHLEDREACLVPLSGSVDITAGTVSFGQVGGRKSPFDGKPQAVYVPADTPFTVAAGDGAAEVALCTAPGRKGEFSPRLIAEEKVGFEERGKGSNRRLVSNILPETEPADSLLVVEVITPGGNWSSYPPHKHDRDALPEESFLEETYYHRLNPKQGFAFQRVYTDDRTIDQTMTVEDGDCVMVPRGYHPVGAPHGYDLYYLNVMAGPKRQWCFKNDPAHDWIAKSPGRN
ncbi:MAG: 5-deoxy-glucuronate isomerase [Kiloniellaceae bacterium]